MVNWTTSVTGTSTRSRHEVPLNRGAKCTRAYDSKVSAPRASDAEPLADGRPKTMDPDGLSLMMLADGAEGASKPEEELRPLYGGERCFWMKAI